MKCKLHIPWLYDPLTDAVMCSCGVAVITAVESAATGRWRWFFRLKVTDLLIETKAALASRPEEQK